MKKKIFTLFLVLTNLIASAQSITEMPLYENGAVPNAKKAENLEKITLKDGVFRIADVSIPTLTRFVPANPNGKSVIICPGGGYTILASGHEGMDVAKQLTDIGVTAFVLKYRIPNDRIAQDKSLAPLQDAQQAIRVVRKNAEKWGLKANKIGIMGFSAGGHLAATATTLFAEKADPSVSDTISVRPDFSILIYPVISFDSLITHKGSRNNLIGANPTAEMTRKFSNEAQVTPQTPPVFLVHAGDDGAVPVENSLRFYQACIKNKVPADMHLYAKGEHGFGLNNKTTEDKWFDRLVSWLKTM
ncbi:MAG: alpha/beta hydrolase [Saprospiraceae bacterium]|nr:alpha/beta hydrolase [Saprospiraceae bacterium]